jgi:indole-3-glycerol phosphate synthase
MTGAHLESIAAVRRCDISGERELVPLEMLQQMALERDDRRDFAAALRAGAPAIVAEIKRASPTAGVIDLDCDPTAAAAAFARGGAAALSVLTEPRCFQGSFLDLSRARKACRLPVMCKDFITCDFHVWKAAAFGADAVLLIAALLDDRRLAALVTLAHLLRLAAVVEVHDEAEAARACASPCDVIGVNNRDLQTFRVDLTTALRLCPALPRDRVVLAESGYVSAAQVREVAAAGAGAVLVGESLMRSRDRAAAVGTLRSVVCSR